MFAGRILFLGDSFVSISPGLAVNFVKLIFESESSIKFDVFLLLIDNCVEDLMVLYSVCWDC